MFTPKKEYLFKYYAGHDSVAYTQASAAILDSCPKNVFQGSDNKNGIEEPHTPCIAIPTAWVMQGSCSVSLLANTLAAAPSYGHSPEDLWRHEEE